MEFWPENQGQSPLYSKFGTVPGRNCSHNYHDRHQVPHYPLYYGELQDQSRESSYWTVPGSRTGGAPQEYTNWTDQDLTAPSPSNFPFILDRHAQQHQELGDYQLHEARDREWTAAQRAAREYERGFLREGWQRRWEPCGPVRYNREVAAKKSDSSYRELEAWAARYSHSLPRRRRIEAELRGASQGLMESSRAPERDSRSGTDPRVAALQQVRQSASIRESGLWDRGSRQQAPTYYPAQTPATDTSHMLDMKEKTCYQGRMFSQPPGYIAPPPYDSPHKGSPVLHHSDTSWKQEGKRQTYWSQPAARKQDVSVDLQDRRKGEKEEFKKLSGNQKSFPELEGLKHQCQETDALQASSPFSIQETHVQREGVLSLQQPQVLQAVENKKINEKPSSKVIEGRKFRLNKKTGGLTIFCLVSRIAGTSETPSLPLCTLQANIQNTELGGISKGLRGSSGINQTHKLADEVDFRAPTVTGQSSASDTGNVKAKERETSASVESEMLEDNLSKKTKTDDVSPEKANTNNADSTFGKQVVQSVQPMSVRYPLWREPSTTSRAETESSSTCLRANSEEGESDVLHNQEDSGNTHPIDIEVRRLDIKTDTESVDSKDLLVIDTTCVVVKMELIPSPKKEHVHYLHTEHSPLDSEPTVPPECDSQLNQDATTEENTETNPFHINERPEDKLDSDLMEKEAPEGESEISSIPMSSSSVPKRETLEERAERILGIPLHDCSTEQQPEDAMSLLDSCVEDQELEPSPNIDQDNDAAVEQIPDDTREEEQSQSQLEVGQTEDAECLQEKDIAKDQATNKNDDFAGLQDQVSEENTDSQLETDIKPSPEIEMTEDPLPKPTNEEGTTDLAEKDTSSHHPSQCLSPNTNPSDSSSLSPSPDCEAPNPALSLTFSSSDLASLMQVSESNIEEGPDPELIALSSSENLAHHPETSSLAHTPSPPPPGSTNVSPSSPPHTDHSPSPPPLDLMDQMAPSFSGVEDQDEDGEASQLISNKISVTLDNDTTEDLVSQQQSESGQPDDTCVKESNVPDEQQTKEAEKDPAEHTLDQSLNISDEKKIQLDILQQQLECVQAEDVSCVTESCMTEEQLPKEANMDPAGLLEQTISPKNVTVSQIQTEVHILQQFDNGKEEDAYLKESYVTEEQSQEEADEDPTGLLEKTPSAENATDSQTQTEVHILQQQFDKGQEEDAYLKESYVTEEQSQEEADEDPTGLLEKTPFAENATDSQTQTEVHILQQQFDNGQEEDAYLKESYVTEEQSEEEADEDPTGLLEKTPSAENATDSQTQTEVHILQQHFDKGQEEDAYLKESCVTEEQSEEEADEGVLKQTPSTENTTDTQAQIKLEVLQDSEPQTEPSYSSPPPSPSDSDCEVSQSPLDVFPPSELPSPPHTSKESDSEFVSLLEMDSVCPAADIPETVPSPLHLASYEESLQFSSSSLPDSALAPALPSSSSTPPQDGSGSVDPDLPLKEEPQYPKSLWDAVNRIRKHTAPDSENEEEEVSELWDPESVGEDLGCTDVMVDMNSARIVFDGAVQQELSTEGRVQDVEVGLIHKDLCHEEPSGHAEEDTLSCSSTSSHGSGDTIIVADEDEVVEMPPDAGTESKTGNDADFQKDDGERSCSAEVKDETAAREEGGNVGDESVTNESSPTDEFQQEVANITREAVEVTETELNENEEEVFMP